MPIFSRENRPFLGQPVTFTAILKRQYKELSDDSNGRVRYGHTWLPFKAEGRGIYIGIRYKQEGIVLYHYEESNEWKKQGTIPCALVVTDERKAPVPVPFENIFPQ